MSVNQATHLSKKEQMQMGSFYTPPELVDIVFDYIKPYINENKEKVTVFDNAAGCGAFVPQILDYDFRVADYDVQAVDYLKQNFSNSKVFHSNSLLNVDRKNYHIEENSYLIQIGNPPYNDTTSEFKNGQKGENKCDEDLFDRDLGVSFLKSYDKLKANLVCILHPLSYLIKQTNFKRLKNFKDNYRLQKGLIFSSSLFPGTGGTKFPIVIGLYERNQSGMNFEYIENFEFGVLDANEKFILSNYETTDGFIRKYPPRKNDSKLSPINTYFYTFRDFNSLKRNASFMNEPHYNGIVVRVENFYKYAYLYCLKRFFKSENEWLYGNLSPLLNIKKLEANKRLYSLYALLSNPVLAKLHSSYISEITDYYFLKSSNFGSPQEIENKIQKQIESLI